MSHDCVICILLSMAYYINTGWVKDIALDELALKSLANCGRECAVLRGLQIGMWCL